MSGSVRAGETPFVGRRTEMALLLDRLAGASHGRGGIVLITGEPGIGKTRLAAEFAAAAAGAGAVVRWGRCYEGEGAPAFWPWMHLLRAHLSDQPGQTVALGLPGVLAELGRLLPELSERLTGPSSPRLEPAQSRFRLFAAVTAFLIADARAAPPLALTLDDLHWADQPSLLLLQFLAREVSGAPLLVVGTYRDTELAEGHPLRGALAQLIREPWVERLPLSGLSVPEIAGYLTTVSGSAPPEDVAAALHRDTNGNPLYVTELAPLLGADPSPQSERRPALSAGVRQTVTLRLDRLSPACRRLLDLAAVCGPDFDAGLLAAAGHLDRDTLFDALEEAERARILVAMEGVPGRFAFSHALVQAALYEEIPTARRIRLHYHVGAALERAWVDDPTHYPAILAHHFHQAAALGAAGRAATWSGRAGDQALASLAYEEAVRHYERALQALDAPLQAPRPAAERRAERRTLLLALGDALNCSGRRDEARDVFAAAATLARGTSPDASARNAADLGRAALGFAGPLVSVGAVDGASVALLEEALATPAAEPAVRARLLARLAMELAWSADAERRARLCAEAIDLVRSTADAAGRAYVLHARHYALWTPQPGAATG
ncbi:MAG: AAA family ATPase [Dehalococcoidia bacterium]